MHIKRLAPQQQFVVHCDDAPLFFPLRLFDYDLTYTFVHRTFVDEMCALKIKCECIKEILYYTHPQDWFTCVNDAFITITNWDGPSVDSTESNRGIPHITLKQKRIVNVHSSFMHTTVTYRDMRQNTILYPLGMPMHRINEDSPWCPDAFYISKDVRFPIAFLTQELRFNPIKCIKSAKDKTIDCTIDANGYVVCKESQKDTTGRRLCVFDDNAHNSGMIMFVTTSKSSSVCTSHGKATASPMVIQCFDTTHHNAHMPSYSVLLDFEFSDEETAYKAEKVGKGGGSAAKVPKLTQDERDDMVREAISKHVNGIDDSSLMAELKYRIIKSMLKQSLNNLLKQGVITVSLSQSNNCKYKVNEVEWEDAI
jgi:hypothetical protein